MISRNKTIWLLSVCPKTKKSKKRFPVDSVELSQNALVETLDPTVVSPFL